MQTIETTHPDYYIILMNTLKRIGVKTSAILIRKSPENTFAVLTGGVEIIATLTKERLTNREVAATGMGNQRVHVMKYSDKEEMFIDPLVRIDLNNLLFLDKYYQTPQMTKENIVNFKRDAETMGFGTSAECSALVQKQHLETKLVYIYEQSPSTNSLALAKQFELNHKNVIQKLLEIPMTQPSFFNQLHWGLYTYDSGNNATTTALYLEVSEEMYSLFVQSMGKPKSQRMVVLRTKKLKEYFKAFQNLRDDLYRADLTEAEIKDLVDLRTAETKKLMTILNTYVTEYNEKYGVGRAKINFPTINRVVFNLVNLNVGINSTKHKVNRNDMNEYIQKKLMYIESVLVRVFNDDFNAFPREFIRWLAKATYPETQRLTDKEMDNFIMEKLGEYNSSHLYVKLEDAPGK